MRFGDGTDGSRGADRRRTLVNVSRCQFLGLIYFNQLHPRRTQSLSWVKRLWATHQEDEGTRDGLTYFEVICWGSQMLPYGLQEMTNLSDFPPFPSGICINGGAIDLMDRLYSSKKGSRSWPTLAKLAVDNRFAGCSWSSIPISLGALSR